MIGIFFLGNELRGVVCAFKVCFLVEVKNPKRKVEENMTEPKLCLDHSLQGDGRTGSTPSCRSKLQLSALQSPLAKRG